MLKKFKNILIKFLVVVVVLSLLSVYLPMVSPISFAIDERVNLATPTNLRWKENSTATATWDVVENANYYLVNVYVYDENNNLIGTQETGTSINEIDLQQEIFSIICQKYIEKYAISFDVKSQYIDNNIIINESEYSSESSLYWVNRKYAIKLDTPGIPSIKEDGTASWGYVGNADYYGLYYKIECEGKTETGFLTGYGSYQLENQNGRITKNIMNAILEEYKDLGYIGKTIKFSFKLVAMPYVDNPKYIDSDFTEYSNVIEVHSSEIIKLDTPGSPSIKEDGTASWGYVENADYYGLYYKIECEGKTETGFLTGYGSYRLENKNGRITKNIMNAILDEYKDLGYIGKTIKFSFKLVATPYEDNPKYIDSDFTEYSNVIEVHSSEIIKLDTPGSPSIKEDGTASWGYVENADYYGLYYKIECEGKTETGFLTGYGSYRLENKNGRITKNIMNVILDEYNDLGYIGKTIKFSFKLVATPYEDNPKYIDSDFTEYSNAVYINPNGSTVIDSITLSPNNPVIAVGRSMYIGKTINPDDAYYSSINWSSSDNSIVTISNMGQITGIKKGNATITAQINNASQNVEVSVYEIESNIKDQNEASKVINEANDVIEAITSDGDITNTDIKDKETTISEIEQGAQNGDMFNVDIKYQNKTANEYAKIKNDITSKFVGYNIAGGNDIKIAISHTDNNGLEHHIANITELKNEVSVKFDMSDNIPELFDGKTREYKLVRLHDNNIEEIDFELNSGIVETSSDKFSDFVLLYKELDTSDCEINGTITSYGNDTDDISIKVYERETGNVMFEESVKGNYTNYIIQDVPAGNYIIKFIKDNHVTREYEIVVDTLNITQDAKICIAGDINSDGKVNIKDWNKLYNHVNETNILTGYNLLCADVNNDGKVNIKDWNRLYDHIIEIAPLL